jgi:hypothetical protein
MEDARRLATLQKKRELKAAGIEMSGKVGGGVWLLLKWRVCACVCVCVCVRPCLTVCVCAHVIVVYMSCPR